MTLMSFRLNPALDAEKLREQYRERRRLHIADFLHREDAFRLYSSLRQAGDWKLLFNQGEKFFELDRSAQAALSPEQNRSLDATVYKSARDHFQYRYETIRVPDGRLAREKEQSALSCFAQFLSSERVLSFVKAVTGEEDIGYADAQATAYGPGHFLTQHDDAVEGKNRRAAYVYGLTAAWRPEWGGLLLFHEFQGHVQQGFSPTFNALNVFSVPQPHSVSIVAPFAGSRRYSVTGWLRSGKQPE